MVEHSNLKKQWPSPSEDQQAKRKKENHRIEKTHPIRRSPLILQPLIKTARKKSKSKQKTPDSSKKRKTPVSSQKTPQRNHIQNNLKNQSNNHVQARKRKTPVSSQKTPQRNHIQNNDENNENVQAKKRKTTNEINANTLRFNWKKVEETVPPKQMEVQTEDDHSSECMDTDSDLEEVNVSSARNTDQDPAGRDNRVLLITNNLTSAIHELRDIEMTPADSASDNDDSSRIEPILDDSESELNDSEEFMANDNEILTNIDENSFDFSSLWEEYSNSSVESSVVSPREGPVGCSNIESTLLDSLEETNVNSGKKKPRKRK